MYKRTRTLYSNERFNLQQEDIIINICMPIRDYQNIGSKNWHNWREK